MAALDSTKLLELKAYSELNNSLAAKAIALQQLNGDYSYIEPVYSPEGSEKSNSRSRRKRTVINDNKMLLYPNPATGYFTVEYQLTESFNSAKIIIFDINGKLVSQQEILYDIDQIIIPTENWVNGQYSISIIADGKTIAMRKITLIK